MNRVSAILFSCMSAAVLAVTGLAACAGSASTSTPVATSESRMSGGFSFSVSVSNTRPRLGETVTIDAELQNVYNTAVALDDMGGSTTIQITNTAGQVVWGLVKARSGTTVTAPVTTGYSTGGSFTWTVSEDPNYKIVVTPGTYTLSVSDTGFHDPEFGQVPFSVTPIQIVVGA